MSKRIKPLEYSSFTVSVAGSFLTPGRILRAKRGLIYSDCLVLGLFFEAMDLIEAGEMLVEIVDEE